MLISLPYSLTKNTDAKASEVMADYNAILAVVNGGLEADNFDDLAALFAEGVGSGANGVIQAGHVSATEHLTLTSSYVDVPGTEKAVTVDQASTALITMTFDFELKHQPAASPVGKAVARGALYLDGAESGQTPEFAHGEVSNTSVFNIRSQACVAATASVALTKGEHKFKLRAKLQEDQTGTVETKECWQTATGYNYLILPS